ncbi:MAG: hypothetical protein AAF570_12120, partial [Bacteroidota bacterium]
AHLGHGAHLTMDPATGAGLLLLANRGRAALSLELLSRALWKSFGPEHTANHCPQLTHPVWKCYQGSYRNSSLQIRLKSTISGIQLIFQQATYPLFPVSQSAFLIRSGPFRNQFLFLISGASPSATCILGNQVLEGTKPFTLKRPAHEQFVGTYTHPRFGTVKILPAENHIFLSHNAWSATRLIPISPDRFQQQAPGSAGHQIHFIRQQKKIIALDIDDHTYQRIPTIQSTQISHRSFFPTKKLLRFSP